MHTRLMHAYQKYLRNGNELGRSDAEWPSHFDFEVTTSRTLNPVHRSVCGTLGMKFQSDRRPGYCELNMSRCRRQVPSVLRQAIR